MILAIDWDDTLVDPRTKEWFPDALIATKRLIGDGHKVIIHSCRVNWPEGREEIKAALRDERLDQRVILAPKPAADLYVDDKACLPDWRLIAWEASKRRKGKA